MYIFEGKRREGKKRGRIGEGGGGGGLIEEVAEKGLQSSHNPQKESRLRL